MSNSARIEKIKERIKDVDENGVGLTEWEINFIAELIDNPPRHISVKQEEIIDRIWEQKVK